MIPDAIIRSSSTNKIFSLMSPPYNLTSVFSIKGFVLLIILRCVRRYNFSFLSAVLFCYLIFDIIYLYAQLIIRN